MRAAKLLCMSFWVLAVAGISGCSTTLFESLPVGKTTICDPAWPGRWNPEEPQHGNQIEESQVEVNADCTEITTIGKDGQDRENFKLNLVTTRAGDFLWASDADRKPECLGSDQTHCGFALMRYVRNDDEIRLYHPDHTKVHAAIAARAVPGYSEATGGQTASPTHDADASGAPPAASASSARTTTDGSADAQDTTRYDNQVGGNAEQIATILEQHPEFFESEPWLILHRDHPLAPVKQP